MSDLKTTGLFYEDGNLHHVESQDIEPVLLHVKYLRETGQTGDKEMRHAAKIPTVISEKWRLARGISFHDMCINPAIQAAFLNSEEARPYRIWQGKI